MPELLHSSSPTRATAARSGRSLLRAAGAAYAVNPQGAAGAYVNDLCAGIFLAAVARDGLRHVRSAGVERQHETLGDLERFGRVELSWRTESGEDAVVSLPDGELALLIGWEERARSSSPGASPARASGVRRAGAGTAPERAAPRRAHGPLLGQRRWRSGGPRSPPAPRCPRVGRHRAQLPAGCAAGPRAPRARPPPGPRHGAAVARRPRHGQVTHALRALARAWRGWCALHYVTDPDSFLTGTDYLMSVATASPGEDEPAWRLIVLEDAGELMGAAARADTGQGLSRVLNLTDGLLGQGQRCLLLVTTNEPVGRLHPALRRPGRCWAEVEFAPFSAREAAAWLRRRGTPRRAPVGGTLAELYALAEDRVVAEQQREAFGFGRAVARS